MATRTGEFLDLLFMNPADFIKVSPSKIHKNEIKDCTIILMSTFLIKVITIWIHKMEKQLYRYYSTKSGLKNMGFLTRGQKFAIWMIIWVTIILMMVFWPVCMQISITKGNLNFVILMTVQRCFPVTHLLITQRNRRMNALTSKLWFGRRSYVTF